MERDVIEQLSSQLLKVLDLNKSGFFKKEDIYRFLYFVGDELELTTLGRLKENAIDDLLKQSGIVDTRINETLILKFMDNYFVHIKKLYKDAAKIDYE